MSGCRVIKLGGSLLEWIELRSSFQKWLIGQTVLTNVVVVGGGKLVEAIRRLDQMHSLPSEASHWLALQAMSVTAHVAAMLLSAELVTNSNQIPFNRGGNLIVLDVLQFMEADAQCEPPLPFTWDVTSDSIAARLADRLDADELVLLKSSVAATPEKVETVTAEALVMAGIVDSYFPKALRPGMPMRCVNLRSANFDEVRIAALSQFAVAKAEG
jgi:5-(aminomethyl)-3-furanmethanol phosphate kinase